MSADYPAIAQDRGVGKNLNSSWQSASQDRSKKVALDWMVTESEDMEDRANSSVSATDLG